MKITQLGSGTPTPSLVRAGSGYLVEVGDDVIVIDHGPGAHHRLLQTGKRAVDVTHLFFSHLHYDHCCDYARLLLTRWDQGADLIPELKVYGPAHTQRMTALLFEPDGVFGPDLNARINHQGSIDIFEKRGGKPPRKWPKPDVTVVKPGAVIDGGRWRVTVARVVARAALSRVLRVPIRHRGGLALLLRRQRWRVPERRQARRRDATS